MRRAISLLHVEDDVSQRKVMAHHLNSLPDLAFAITAAESEDQAVAQFARDRFQIVILDYHLAQGNGLSCLKKLREQDSIVPIIAVSGAATPEIAAELLRVGADDYVSKQDLKPERLAQTIRSAIARADAWHRQTNSGSWARVPVALVESFSAMCQQFVKVNGKELLEHLDAFQAAATAANVSQEQLQALFTTVRGGQTAGGSEPDRQMVLRPLLLEILLRLFPENTVGEEGGSASSDRV